MKTAPLSEAALDTLISVLEQTLPGFTFNLTHLGKGMPAMLNWKHDSKALAKFEGRRLLMRCVTAPTVRAAFLHIHNRLDLFAKDQEERKQKDAQAKKKLERQQRAEAERQAARARRKNEKEPKKKPEPEDDEEPLLGPVLEVQHAEPLPDIP